MRAVAAHTEVAERELRNGMRKAKRRIEDVVTKESSPK